MDHIIPLGLGLAVGTAVALLVCRRSRSRELSVQAQKDQRELAMLRDEVGHLRLRNHQHMDFFVNFPDIVKTLTGALSLEQVTSALSRGITALLEVEMVAIFLAESQTELRLVDGVGFARQHRQKLRGTLRELEAKPILRRRGVVPLHSSGHGLLAESGMRPKWGVAIWHGERLFGMIVISEVLSDQTNGKRVLAMLADLSGVGLAAASRVSQIRHEAETDALTGLANRRTLQRRTMAELQRAASYHTQLSLVMIDVDNFKHYNDTNGHQAGDVVLKQVAQLIRSTTRRTDLVARYGGEEFTVLLIGADQQQAFRHAERIRRTIEAHDFPNGAKQPLGRVTISLGVGTAPDDAAESSDLFKVADQALYQAKEGVVTFVGEALPGDSQNELATESLTEQALADAIALARPCDKP